MSRPFVESVVLDPAVAGRMSWEELEAANLCECGRDLANHPPVRRPKPLGGWRPQLDGTTTWRNPNKPLSAVARAANDRKSTRAPSEASTFQIGRRAGHKTAPKAAR